MAERRSSGVSVALVVLALLVTGCRLTVTAGVEVDRDGSGQAVLSLHLDEAMLTELDRLEVDPTAELTAAAEEVDGWEVIRESADDGGLVVTVQRPVATPAELGGAFRELTGGLSDDDPAVLVDLDVTVDVEGAATVDGEVELRAPAGPGLVDPDPDVAAAEAAEMVALVTEHVSAHLELRLPAAPSEHDADTVDGATLRYDLAVGEVRTVTARAPAPGGPPPELLLAAGAGTLVLVAALLTLFVIRRRRAGRPATD